MSMRDDLIVALRAALGEADITLNSPEFDPVNFEDGVVPWPSDDAGNSRPGNLIVDGVINLNDIVDAVVKELRDPTIPMLVAGHSHLNSWEVGLEVEIWHAMVDAFDMEDM